MIDGEPLSRIAGWGSTCQAPKSCWLWRSRADVGSSVMLLPSYVNDGIVEHCWRWRCRVDIGHGMLLLSSHVGDGAADVT
jgi:hypothetical protein